MVQSQGGLMTKPTFFSLNKKQKISLITVVIGGAVLNTAFMNCSKTNFQLMDVELENSSVFGTVTDVKMGSCSDVIKKHHLVDCSLPIKMADGSYKDRKEWEREEALKEVAEDPTKVPVQFAYSFGQKLDNVAYYAHERAILTKGRTFLKSEDKDYSLVIQNNSQYYKADHTKAKEQYIKGERCFYSTIKTTGELKNTVNGYFDILAGSQFSVPVAAAGNASLRHVVHYMYYGYCAGTTCATNQTSRYGAGAYGADMYPNRLLTNNLTAELPYYDGGQLVPNAKERQFIKLYVADLRDDQFGLSNENFKIIKTEENAIRGKESTKSVEDMIDLKTVMANFEFAVENLSQNIGSYDYDGSFNGIDGAPQLLANLCSSAVTGTSLATQYTPLVVDLGEEDIMTTGLGNGVYFDMQALGQKHRVAWLGAQLSEEMNKNYKNIPFKQIKAGQVEDGFLVVPDQNGQVTSGKNLFGPNMVVNGKTYENGFEAIKALTQKSCLSNSVQDRFLGPWDAQNYESIVKVWVDVNKNGQAESEEIKTLREAGIAAVGVCYINKYGLKDGYGNSTALRGEIVYQNPVTATDVEIMDFLDKKNNKVGLKKRLIVDITFKADTKDKLK